MVVIAYFCVNITEMNYIDINPIIEGKQFGVSIVLSDPNVLRPIVFSIAVRRGDTPGYVQREFIYPDPNTPGNTKMFFFSVPRTTFAQIIDVYANGVRLFTKYTVVDPNQELYARYNDSPCVESEGVNPEHIVLGFDVLKTEKRDTKVLKIADTTTWGAISDRPAVFRITPPGKPGETSHYVGKNQVNYFTSMHLGYNEPREFVMKDLPDGIYDITLEGSPSTQYSLNHKYLKTDATVNKLAKLIARQSIDSTFDSTLEEKIREIRILLEMGEANAICGNTGNAVKLLEKANKIINQAQQCVKC